MRILVVIFLGFFLAPVYSQFPYVKKLTYPEQLPTQVIYGMLADSRGYIWIGTDKGLYRFNGRTFVSVPFINSSLKSVSYLQEDNEGKIWCMNFHNQVFYFQNDTLRRFEIDPQIIKNTSSFLNVTVGSKHVWLQSFDNMYVFDKVTHKNISIFNTPVPLDLIIASAVSNDIFYAFSTGGWLFRNGPYKKGWTNLHHPCNEMGFIPDSAGVIGMAAGTYRNPPFEINNKGYRALKPIQLPPDKYIFKGVRINRNEYWLCTQNGAYHWDKETGETRCLLPNERVSDVVKDYQGNYWISTLDNGLYICSSLQNTLHKVYNDPLLDNFTRLLILPNGEVVAGNTQGLMSKYNFDTRKLFRYNLPKAREIEFISYDTSNHVIISNRGAFKQDNKEPLGIFDYSKGIDRDRYGNMLVAVFNAALVMNADYGKLNRVPVLDCPLYKSNEVKVTNFDHNHPSLLLRLKRSMAVLGSWDKTGFWVAYEDGLYNYRYDGKVNILKDRQNNPVIGKSLLQFPDNSLVVGTSTKGVMIFENGLIARVYNEKNGLSSLNVRKLLIQNQYIWVLTDAGLDRIDKTNGSITNYLDEYGLSNIIINDFCIRGDTLLFATPTGILVRYNTPAFSNGSIKFPLLRAVSNGMPVSQDKTLPSKNRDIIFYFEALHYISPEALTYHYRLKGLDTVWRSAGNFNNQVSFNRLSPGKYYFEIQAVAGAGYKSDIRSFSFGIAKPFWQKWWFWLIVLMCLLLISWVSLRQWKMRLLKRQTLKVLLLKSQLVALRAQMNPHFLYNVLNTVQGLVYGNRKTEAGALLGNFSDLMRKTLQSSDKQLLTLTDEIETLRLYLELEKARFNEGFSYTIEIADLEDISAIYIPTLLLQPFAENAVKHGLLHKRGIKTLDIRFEKTAEGVLVTIDDNGIGRQHSMAINQRKKNKPPAFATLALNERMVLFNRLYKKKITCVITDKLDEDQKPVGTMIQVRIPDYSKDPDAL